MSFALHNAAQTFQHFMDDILRGLNFWVISFVFQSSNITFLSYKGSQPLKEPVTHLQPSKDSQSPQSISGHAEILYVIYAPHGGHTGTTA
jgi:hypothetical protein